MKRVLIVVAVLLMVCSLAYASNDTMLVLSSFAIEAEGHGATGPVSISGQHDGSGIVDIQATAFEQDYVLSKAQLDQLRGFLPNGVKLMQGGGFDGVSKRVYVHFIKGDLPGFEETTTLILTAEGETWLDTTSNMFYEAD